jgi:hypothetical protein
MTLLDAKLLAQEEVARLDDLPGFFGRGSRRRAHGPALAVSRGEKSSKVELFLNNQNGDLPYALEREVFDTRFALSEKEWAQIYAKTRGAGTHAEVYGVNFQRLQGEAFKDISLFVFQTPWNNTRTLELWQKYRFLRPFPPCKHCERFVLKTRVWPPVGSTWPLAK